MYNHFIFLIQSLMIIAWISEYHEFAIETYFKTGEYVIVT